MKFDYYGINSLDRFLGEVRKSGNVDYINPNIVGSAGMTALIWASMYGEVDLIKYLLSLGADINKQDNVGNTALITAAQLNRVDAVLELLKNKANPNIENNQGDNFMSYVDDWEGVDSSILDKINYYVKNSYKDVTNVEDMGWFKQ